MVLDLSARTFQEWSHSKLSFVQNKTNNQNKRWQQRTKEKTNTLILFLVSSGLLARFAPAIMVNKTTPTLSDLIDEVEERQASGVVVMKSKVLSQVLHQVNF
jgi:hypothetical protein